MTTRTTRYHSSLGLSMMLLLLTLSCFAVTTLYLSATLMNAETSIVVSPATLVEAPKRRMEGSHDASPWKSRLKGRFIKSRFKTHQEQHQATQAEGATVQTVVNPCGQHMDKERKPSRCADYNLPFTTDKVPHECWPRIVLLPSYPTRYAPGIWCFSL